MPHCKLGHLKYKLVLYLDSILSSLQIDNRSYLMPCKPVFTSQQVSMHNIFFYETGTRINTFSLVTKCKTGDNPIALSLPCIHSIHFGTELFCWHCVSYVCYIVLHRDKCVCGEGEKNLFKVTVSVFTWRDWRRVGKRMARHNNSWAFSDSCENISKTVLQKMCIVYKMFVWISLQVLFKTTFAVLYV